MAVAEPGVYRHPVLQQNDPCGGTDEETQARSPHISRPLRVGRRPGACDRLARAVRPRASENASIPEAVPTAADPPPVERLAGVRRVRLQVFVISPLRGQAAC